jgi:hypothetical protein
MMHVSCPAQNVKLRAMVVPQEPAQPAEATEAAPATEHEVDHAQGWPGHIG